MKFLLVDDHSIIRAGLKILITDFMAHCTIDDAFDGDSAFEKIKNNDFDLVMLDVNMPNTDSLGLVSNILAIKPDTKILMFSMNSEDNYAKRYLKMGAMGYVRKDESEFEFRTGIFITKEKSYSGSNTKDNTLNINILQTSLFTTR